MWGILREKLSKTIFDIFTLESTIYCSSALDICLVWRHWKLMEKTKHEEFRFKFQLSFADEQPWEFTCCQPSLPHLGSLEKKIKIGCPALSQSHWRWQHCQTMPGIGLRTLILRVPCIWEDNLPPRHDAAWGRREEGDGVQPHVHPPRQLAKGGIIPYSNATAADNIRQNTHAH